MDLIGLSEYFPIILKIFFQRAKCKLKVIFVLFVAVRRRTKQLAFDLFWDLDIVIYYVRVIRVRIKQWTFFLYSLL